MRLQVCLLRGTAEVDIRDGEYLVMRIIILLVAHPRSQDCLCYLDILIHFTFKLYRSQVDVDKACPLLNQIVDLEDDLLASVFLKVL